MASDKAQNMKDPFEYLSEDHRKVEAVFKTISATTNENVSEREEAFVQLQNLLEEHAALEEATLYPALLAIPETRALSQEAGEEHADAKKLLGEIAELDADSDEWMAKVNELEGEISHHVEEEETEMFQEARSALGEEGVENLKQEMIQFLSARI